MRAARVWPKRRGAGSALRCSACRLGVIFTRSVFGGAGTAAAPIDFAAASMKTALDLVAAAWKAQNGKKISIAYASSVTHSKQIEQGAPADFVPGGKALASRLMYNRRLRAETLRQARWTRPTRASQTFQKYNRGA